VGSKEGKDRRSERGDIIGVKAGFLRGVVDVATEDGDKYVHIPAARFNRQVTGEVGCR
jgi:hypothetical protein